MCAGIVPFISDAAKSRIKKHMPNIRAMTLKSPQIFRQSYYIACSGAEVSYFHVTFSSAQHGKKELMKKKSFSL
jgi:hypothetical protein